LNFDVLCALSFSSITNRLQVLALRALVRALDELDSVRFVRVLCIHVLLIFCVCRTIVRILILNLGPARFSPRRVEQRALALCALVRALDEHDSVRFVCVLRIVLLIFCLMRTVGTCLNSDLCIYVLCDFRLARRVEQRALALYALVRALDYLDSVRFVRVL